MTTSLNDLDPNSPIYEAFKNYPNKTRLTVLNIETAREVRELLKSISEKINIPCHHIQVTIDLRVV